VDAFNRAAIVGLAFAWVIFMALVILLTWGADSETIERLGDLVSYLDDHTDNASKLILSLGAAALIVLSLIVIVVELVPAEPVAQIRLESVTGATAILPAEAITQRLERELRLLPQVQEAQAMVTSRDRGLAVALDLVLAPDANVTSTTDEACRLAQETIEQQIGVALVGLPTVRIAFGSAMTAARPAPSEPEPGPPPAEADASEEGAQR
jgi:phosphotransferase system  glucose/maltose/N-acetylglucosamine-specific IIC component